MMISIGALIRNGRLIAMAGLVLAMVPTPGWSLFAAGCPCGVVAGQHDRTREHVTEATTVAAREIIRGLRAQTRQLSDFLDRQVEADRRMADATAQIDTQRLREEIRARAESGAFDPSPDSCLQYDLLKSPIDRSLPMTVDRVVGPVQDWTAGEALPIRAGGVRLAPGCT
ncbi:MAG: hypothetical protein OXC91_07035, partial [Rhodobacteraceae bacterium]|nr:hypothetical protein [Paracoccaceae bacterium]